MAQLTKTAAIMRYIAAVLRTIEYGCQLPKLPEGVSFRDVYILSKKHSLASTLWYAIEDEVRAQGESELVARFEKARSVDYVVNLRQTEEFANLTKLLTDNKHPFLPMKGFLFKELWRRPEYRTMADMDIYVSEDELTDVTSLLLSNGYTPDVEGAVHDTFNKPPCIHVEIHKAVRSGSRESFECWEHKADNPYWYVMSPVDFMVFNIAHIYKHYTSGGCGARSLFDVHLYLAKRGGELDREKLNELLLEEGLLEFYIKLLHLVHFWYGDGCVNPEYSDSRYLVDNQPTDELLEMEFFIATGGAYGNIDNRVEYAMRDKTRIGYIISRAFPPYSIMREIFWWVKKYPILLPIAYPLRLIKALFNGRMGNELRATNRVDEKKKGKSL